MADGDPCRNIRETIMSKHDEKLEQKSPAKPVSITKDGELSDEQLKEISGGKVTHEPFSITKHIDSSSPKVTGGDKGPTETVTFNYGSVQVTYTNQ
jgi:type VI protein secretion system component Hcp